MSVRWLTRPGIIGGLALATAATVLAAPPAAPPARHEVPMKIEKSIYGKTPAGQEIELYTCTNKLGAVLRMITWGAAVVSLEVPDRNGEISNVALGFESPEGYLENRPYFGGTIGRFCNRIAKGRFELDGRQFTLARNDGPNHLHGGAVGFNKVLWKAEPIESANEVGIDFTYVSPDGDEGYPGNLTVHARYTLQAEKNDVSIAYQAKTDQATPINLTNHGYWNLAGNRNGSILGHELTIFADEYLTVDETLIPTGERTPVAGTPLDFRQPHKIGERIRQLQTKPQGYDHCYVLREPQAKLRLAARAKDPASGRVMDVYTTQPGIQFYSGNFLDGSAASGGYAQYSGFCLETQHFPDSPNHPAFPTTILRPGESYAQSSLYSFHTE